MRPIKKLLKIAFFAALTLLYTNTSAVAVTPPDTTLLQVPVETITDKIRGGLLGQILGNLNGLPHEFAFLEEPGNIKNYTPSLPNGAWTDDDTDFEWVYIIEMQKKRNVFLSSQEVASLWKEKVNDRIWCSNRYARYLMDINIQPPLTGVVALNPWAEFNISGQFLSETFGLIAPAMPQTAAKIGLNYTRVAVSGEPAQTTQLFTTMIATAFIENDINKILDAGIASLDPQSKTLKIIHDIKEWHSQHPDNWRETRLLLKEKYTLEGGNLRDNNGTELNTGAIIAALLYGEGDFAESLRLAFNLGWDADCNAATVGTIVGATTGYRKMLGENNEGNWLIVDRYKNTTRDNMPMDETISSFADRIIELFEMVNEDNGGKKRLVNQTMMYEIPQEKPAPVIRVSSPEKEKQLVKNDHEQEIINNLQNGNREEKARAAYMAVSLGMDKSLSEKYPDHWKEAAYDLSGYWKIMDNIFYGGGFKGIYQVKENFVQAGFKKPLKRYSDSELYKGTEVWKDPKEMY